MRNHTNGCELMFLRKNDVLRLEIVDINNLGYGVGKCNGMTVFVAGAVDGDVCDVKLIKVNKSYCVGIIQKLITSSPFRIKPVCPSSSRCGGCSYQSVSYKHELELKKNYVKHAFKKVGLGDVIVNETVSNINTEEYRNKAQYPISYENGEYVIGFYAPKTHRVISADKCTLQPMLFSDICKEMKKCFAHFGFSVYDETTGSGLLRHLYLRTSADRRSVMLCLVINGSSTSRDSEFAEYIRANVPKVSTLLLNHNTADTNVVLGDKYKCLYGDGYISDILCGVTLEIAPSAFYQVNHDMTELLYKKASELAALTGAETVYDLYCGIGSIGLSMHKLASRIVGIDIESSAIDCARRNAVSAGIDNAHFHCADASNSDNLFESAGIFDSLENSVVIFDPPRKGSSEKLINYVCEKHPIRVIYISCNPDTLARDCTFFINSGYKPSDVTPFDLFPRTGHVESVVCLSRN